MRTIFILVSQLKIDNRNIKKNKKLFKLNDNLSKALTIVNRHKYEASIREWDNAIKVDPNNELLWNNKGVSLVRLGDLKKAI